MSLSAWRHSRRDSFTLRDLVTEALYGVASRPARLLLTMAGTVMGTTSVVVTLGLAATASGQIDSQFDAVAATQVVITAKSVADGDATNGVIPWDAEDRVASLAGGGGRPRGGGRPPARHVDPGGRRHRSVDGSSARLRPGGDVTGLHLRGARVGEHRAVLRPR